MSSELYAYCLTNKSYHKRNVASTKILPSKLRLLFKSGHEIGLFEVHSEPALSDFAAHMLFILSLSGRYGLACYIRHYRPELG